MLLERDDLAIFLDILAQSCPRLHRRRRRDHFPRLLRQAGYPRIGFGEYRAIIVPAG